MSEQVPVYTAEQVRRAERPLIAAGAPLMQRAAAALAVVVREQLGQSGPGAQGTPVPRVLVLAGGGDNGGDALFAAAGLTDAAAVDVLLVSERFHAAALAAAEAAGVRLVDIHALGEAAGRYAVVVDGIVGIGASRDSALRGTAREVVTALQHSFATRGTMPQIVAVDIPSGLHPDTGAADDAVLPASVTVTFGAVKAGLVTGRGPELAGEVVLVDIGLAPALDRAEPVGRASVSRVVTAPARS